MAPLTLAKKSKKAAPKAASEAKTAAVPAAESSSKPSKTLKRKNEAEPDLTAAEESQPASAPKKAKKESVPSSTKLVKAPKSILKSSKDSATSKKSKPAEPIPTSISRPRKPETTPPAKSKKAKAPAPVVEESENEEVEDAEEANKSGEESEEGHLHGFSTDDDDSSDEEAMDDEPMEFDIGSLPTVAKDDASVKRKLEKAKKEKSEDRGVLFLGRLPHGFYEDQLKAYFSQFGTVTRLRVSRNKKTGKSKHYGFIEFDSSAVAQIVAETMDNYLLMGHIMRCKLIPKEEVHPELWVGANRKWRVVPRDRVERESHNKPRTEEEQKKASKRLLKRQRERKLKLEKAGFKYDFDAAGYKKPATVQA